MIEPTSGNEVPPGALPNEVKDDVPIMGSEGEYMIPANVVRYLGLEKIEAMVAKAKEALEAAEGPAQTDPALAPQEPEMPPQDPAMGVPQGMAEGGSVQAAAPATGVRAFTSPDGQIMYIPFLDGKPVVGIPQGYQPADGSPAPQPTQTDVRTGRPTEDKDTYGDFADGEAAKSPSEWSATDFVKFGSQMDSFGSKLIKGAVGALLPYGSGKVLLNLHERNMAANVPSALDQMMETGMNPDGSAISPEEMGKLAAVREQVREKYSAESGVKADPFEKLTTFAQRIGSALGMGGGGGSAGEPMSALKSGSLSGGNDNSKANYEAAANWKETQAKSNAPKNDFGNTKADAAVTGGLYAKGGLVTRRGPVRAPKEKSKSLIKRPNK